MVEGKKLKNYAQYGLLSQRSRSRSSDRFLEIEKKKKMGFVAESSIWSLVLKLTMSQTDRDNHLCIFSFLKQSSERITANFIW